MTNQQRAGARARVRVVARGVFAGFGCMFAGLPFR